MSLVVASEALHLSQESGLFVKTHATISSSKSNEISPTDGENSETSPHNLGIYTSSYLYLLYEV